MKAFLRLVVFLPVCGWGATFQTVYTFPSGIGPAAADVGLTMDPSGVMYGVISGSQALPYGAVFRFDPASGSVETLHVFAGGTDGAAPHQTLLRDSAGKLYGTTQFGGDLNCRAGGCGLVFRLDPVTFRITTLHAFADYAVEGAFPATGGMVLGLGGNLFGATQSGGAAGGGTMYEIAPGGGALSVIVSFSGTPAGGVVADASGALYGATEFGGFAQAGTLFKLTPPAQGQTAWTPTTLYGFTGTFDGGYPLSGVVAGLGGALFGTAQSGGFVNGFGTLFRMMPATGQFRVLHKFSGAAGGTPIVPLALDAAFNLYGVTPTGGPPPRHCTRGCGSIYQVGRPGWRLTSLFDFNGGANGKRPQSPLAIDASGAFYGTALGGKDDGGTIFKISP